MTNARRPGDLILDRYMPDASEAEREEARERLRAFARLLLRTGARLAAEAKEEAIRQKGALALESENGNTPLP